jgi:hypothetical protein
VFFFNAQMISSFPITVIDCVKSKNQSECRIRRITNRHFVGSPSKIPTPPFNPSFFCKYDSLHQQTPNRETFIVPDSLAFNQSIPSCQFLGSPKS